MADNEADHARRWLARQLEWERVLEALRRARHDGTPRPRRERPAA